MKKFYAILCALMLLVTTACSSNTPAPENEGPKEELTVAIGGQITTLDPGLTQETVNNYIIRHLSSGLFRTDEENHIVNDLAEDYTVSEDGLTYTFTLRDDAVWSDGQPVTSSDFSYGILRNLTYGADNSWAIYFPLTYLKGAEAIVADENFDPVTGSIEGIATPDEKTLIMNLTKPCAWFPQMLTNFVWHPLRSDVASHHESLWALQPGYPTTGAYTLAECNENEKAVIVKNDKYYDADKITLPKIEFLVMADSDAQSLAFQNNEIDIAMNINATIAETFDDQDAVWKMPQVSNYFVALNSGESGPDYLKNVDVRRALALSIDKTSLVNTIGSEEYYKILHGYVPFGFAGVEGDFRTEQDAKEKYLEYDPEEAKSLLAEAGYNESNPLKIVYKYSQSQLHADVAQILQQMWAAVGIDCELQVVESGVFYNQVDNGDFETSRYGYSAGDDPSQFLSLWTKDQQIVAAVNDSKFDDMIDKAGYLVDHADYMEALHEAEHYLIQEQVYLIPLFNYNTPGLKKTNIQNVEMWGLIPYYGKVTFA